MPLPISWIAVFCGVTIPYVGVLAAIGVPFNHNLFFLYVLPPGVLTWLITRPVLENKRLPELLVSQLRYIGEPRTWCRLKPLSEKDGIRVYARVWHRAPTAVAEAAERSMAVALAARAAGERAPTLPGRVRPGGTQGPDRAPGAGRPDRAPGADRKAWRGGQDGLPWRRSPPTGQSSGRPPGGPPGRSARAREVFRSVTARGQAPPPSGPGLNRPAPTGQAPAGPRRAGRGHRPNRVALSRPRARRFPAGCCASRRRPLPRRTARCR